MKDSDNLDFHVSSSIKNDVWLYWKTSEVCPQIVSTLTHFWILGKYRKFIKNSSLKDIGCYFIFLSQVSLYVFPVLLSLTRKPIVVHD
jgi:hypothetical protein